MIHDRTVKIIFADVDACGSRFPSCFNNKEIDVTRCIYLCNAVHSVKNMSCRSLVNAPGSSVKTLSFEHKTSSVISANTKPI
jgi:hypothetical protein